MIQSILSIYIAIFVYLYVCLIVRLLVRNPWTNLPQILIGELGRTTLFGFEILNLIPKYARDIIIFTPPPLQIRI